MKSMSGEDTSFVSKLEIHDEATLDLLVSERNLPGVAVNLKKLVRINDALAARRRCDSRTNIEVAETGFPAYLLRLDPVVHGSTVRMAINVPEASASSDIPQSFLALSDVVQRRRQQKTPARGIQIAVTGSRLGTGSTRQRWSESTARSTGEAVPASHSRSRASSHVVAMGK
jgi:hypothetical protein